MNRWENVKLTGIFLLICCYLRKQSNWSKGLWRRGTSIPEPPRGVPRSLNFLSNYSSWDFTLSVSFSREPQGIVLNRKCFHWSVFYQNMLSLHLLWHCGIFLIAALQEINRKCDWQLESGLCCVMTSLYRNLLVTSGSQDWRPVQMCFLEDW